MCTAISWHAKNHYFGRNLDLEYHYDETVTITPRSFPLTFRMAPANHSHFAWIGMATLAGEYPLYYDGTNEQGLSVAALNFPGNAVYLSPSCNMINIAPFEVIPWILCQCKSVRDTKVVLENTNITSIKFSDAWPLTPLHWIVADKRESIVVEPTITGLNIYDDPVGVLTNNPPFDYHMHNLCNYLGLSNEEPVNRLSNEVVLKPYSRGMGAMGLPGDLSSASRFIKATFTKLNAEKSANDTDNVGQFFHILGSVEQQSGCVRIHDGFERTVYTSCCDTDNGIYYYTTYENQQITAIRMTPQTIESEKLSAFPLRRRQCIYFENA